MNSRRSFFKKIAAGAAGVSLVAAKPLDVQGIPRAKFHKHLPYARALLRNGFGQAYFGKLETGHNKPAVLFRFEALPPGLPLDQFVLALSGSPECWLTLEVRGLPITPNGGDVLIELPLPAEFV